MGSGEQNEQPFRYHAGLRLSDTDTSMPSQAQRQWAHDLLWPARRARPRGPRRARCRRCPGRACAGAGACAATARAAARAARTRPHSASCAAPMASRRASQPRVTPKYSSTPWLRQGLQGPYMFGSISVDNVLRSHTQPARQPACAWYITIKCLHSPPHGIYGLPQNPCCCACKHLHT